MVECLRRIDSELTSLGYAIVRDSIRSEDGGDQAIRLEHDISRSETEPERGPTGPCLNCFLNKPLTMRVTIFPPLFLCCRTRKGQPSRESPACSNLLAFASWRLGVRYFFAAWRGLHPASLRMLRVTAFGGAAERQPRAESIIA